MNTTKIFYRDILLGLAFIGISLYVFHYAWWVSGFLPLFNMAGVICLTWAGWALASAGYHLIRGVWY